MTDTPNPASRGLDGEGAPAAPDATPSVGIGGGGDFTPEVQQLLARWLVEDGHATQEQVDAMLKAGDVEPPAPDNRSPEAREIDAAFPPAKPEDYQMPRFATDADSVQDIMRVEEASRAWLAEARLPAEIGSAIAADAHRTAALWQTMNDNAKEVWSREQLAIATRILGPSAEEKIALARQLVDEIEAKKPGLKNFLENSGAGSCAAVVVQLANHAARLAARLPQ